MTSIKEQARRDATKQLSHAILAFERTWGVPRRTLIHLCARIARLEVAAGRRLTEVVWEREINATTLQRLAAYLNAATHDADAARRLEYCAERAGCSLALGCYGPNLQRTRAAA